MIAPDLSQMVRPIDSVREDPTNARTHDDRNVAAIAESLTVFGQRKPIIALPDGTVIAGNGTLRAAKMLGWDEIAVATFEDEGKARAYALADNRTAELAKWDETVLAQTLDGMSEELRKAVGFSDGEIDRLRATLREPVGDEIPEPPADPITKLGDLWLLGKHRLLCGDSTKAEDVARVMGGIPADLIVTSPPYNQRLDGFKPSGMHAEGDWVGKVGRLAYADSMDEESYQAQQSAALVTWFNVCRDGASMFYNHKNRYRDKRVVSPLAWLPGPWALRQEVIWSRPGSVTQNARMFLPSDERVYWMYRGDDFFFDDTTEIKTYSTVWSIPCDVNRTHAAPFPIELPTRCIRACSKPGDSVFEPYCGSGTTLIASDRLDRICHGIELDPGYCDVIVQRWETATGGKAERG